MNTYEMSIVYVDQRGFKTRISHRLGTFDLGTPEANYSGAVSAFTQIQDAYDAISDAFKAKATLSEVMFEDSLIPAEADVTDELVVVTRLTAAGEALKTWPLRVPAPDDAVFLADGKTLDTTNAAVIDLVQQLAQHAEVSDGEKIDTSVQNGIEEGYWRSKSRK